jgi:hypothetical protein
MGCLRGALPLRWPHTSSSAQHRYGFVAAESQQCSKAAQQQWHSNCQAMGWQRM